MAFQNGWRGPDIVSDGLVLYLDAGSPNSYRPDFGTTWKDMSGFNNSGSLINGPTYSSANGGSIVFDGTNDRVLINCAANIIRSYDTTCQFTVKLPVYSGGQRCILSYRSGGGGNLYVGKESGGIFTYYNGLSTPGYTVGSIPDNTIAICALVINATAGSISVYINGILAGTATGRTGFSTAYNSIMYLGFDSETGESMLGNFYNFMHYNKVLLASEVLQNYNAQKSRFGL